MIDTRRRNLVVAAVLLAMLLAALDQTIVSTALPTMVADLGGGAHLSWVVTSYLLAETVMTVLIGKFGDLYGRKKTFLVSVALFLVGSFFAGWSGSMGTLIAFRAVQGLGAGGLMVTSMAIIADVVPLKDRGRFQGFAGAVFGIATVAGPLLGGLFVDHLSWRWAFYVNIPLGVAVVAVAIAALPATRTAGRPRIDYAGIALIALAATGLTLVTSWGGTEYPWTSPTILWMAAGSVVLLVAFVFVEQRAAEPMLPMRLFRSRVFTVSGVLSFVVGFAMLGGITYLPIYLQYVRGESATASGLWMLPLIAGLMATALLTGSTISRTGRYRVFPLLGSAGLTIGLFLLSLLDASTSYWVMGAFMVVLGAGIGLVMQVPVIVVQSTTNYTDLGVATSGISFLRTMGSSFGVAIFGTIYANQLPHHLVVPPGVDPRAIAGPAAVHALPDAVKAPIVAGYAETVHTMFLLAAPIGLVALAVAFFLPQVQLRDTSRAAASGNSGVGESFAAPPSNSYDELRKLVSAVVAKSEDDPGPAVLRRSGVGLPLEQAWLLGRVYKASADDGVAALAEIAEMTGVPGGIFEPTARALVRSGHLAFGDDGYRFTDLGSDVFTRLVQAWRCWLLDQLRDWDEPDHRDFARALDSFTDELVESGRRLSRV
ncbi:MDR family MFS transporter [Lentzea sp. CC55]|uniref:MDR family MFS transporter n=1 Tax=Lentzea sp. CC55 TaxID=2884909 RepID=UPI001F2394B8|nr:MDR family MFS transporter [Lentzea sp. CC55]MCG8927926.1 MFS transporter [Lentzea sp. CC55]